MRDGCDTESEFACAAAHRNSTRSRCVPRSSVNDGKRDCFDGSDELVDAGFPCFEQSEFRCAKSDRCLPRYLVNDGFADCDGGEDERVADFRCLDAEFSCEEGDARFRRCISRAWVGNGARDCSEGSDEAEGGSFGLPCLSDEFACADGRRCVPRTMVCDGIQNCRDGSDEIDGLYLRNVYFLS